MKAKDFIDDFGEAAMGCGTILLILFIFGFIMFLCYKRLEIKEREVEVLEKMVDKDTAAFFKVIDFSKKL